MSSVGYFRTWRSYEVRFTSMSRHFQCPSACPKCANSCHSAASFDHLVGDRKDDRWNGQAEGPGGFEIDHQLELGGLHDRQVGGLLTLEYPTGVDAGETISIGEARTITNQTTGGCELAILIDSRHPLPCCQYRELFRLPAEKLAGTD